MHLFLLFQISYFFENVMQGPEVLCMKKADDLMTDPPFMNISFELILSDFCTINMSALEIEMSTFIHAEQIGDAVCIVLSCIHIFLN